MATTRNLGTIVVQFVRDSKGRLFIRAEVRFPDGGAVVTKQRIKAGDRTDRDIAGQCASGGELLASKYEQALDSDAVKKANAEVCEDRR